MSECIDVMEGVVNNVKSINEYWLLTSLAEYIYLYVLVRGCVAEFDVTDITRKQVTLVIMIKCRDGVEVGRVYVKGKVVVRKHSILFKPVETSAVKRG